MQKIKITSIVKVWKYMHYLLQRNRCVHGLVEILFRIVENLVEDTVILKVCFNHNEITFYFTFVLFNFHFQLLVSRLGDLRAENDVTCTFEGENNVLIQQASNWLLNQWSNVLSGKSINSPLKTADFMKDANNILIQKFSYTTVDDILKPESMKII